MSRSLIDLDISRSHAQQCKTVLTDFFFGSYPITLKLCWIVRYIKLAMNEPLFVTPPPNRRGGGGLYWNHFICLYVCSFVLLSVCLILFGRYLLNHSTVFNQTWFGGVLSWGSASCRKIGWLSTVKVTAGAYIVNIWLFSLYLLNYWSVTKIGLSAISSKVLVCLQPNFVW